MLTACTLLQPVEDCQDGVDNDEDGLADCADDDCTADAACQEDCGSGEDEDLDGLADCLDPDCADPACDEVCDDGFDNDLDGLTDCEDGECFSSALCEEDCLNERDDDRDGLTDCMDDDCFGAFPCLHPDGVQVSLHGGQFDQQIRSVYWTSNGQHYTTTQFGTTARSLSAVSYTHLTLPTSG